MRKNAEKQQREVLDNLIRDNRKPDEGRRHTSVVPPASPSKRQEKQDDASLIKEFSYQIARGEVRQIKSKISKVTREILAKTKLIRC
jgi:hypothetical protein